MIALIIIGYILGMVIVYGIARNFILKDDDFADICLSVCVGIMWPGFLAFGMVGCVLCAVFWGIGKLLDFLVFAVKNLIYKIKEKHNGKS